MDISSVFLTIIAPICIVYVALKLKDNNKIALRQVEEQLELQKENNNLLRELVAAIKENH